MKRAICLWLFVVMLIGCAAAREEKKRGYWGEDAYSVTKIQDGVFKVTIREDPEAAPSECGDITLVRCADAAVAHGFSYFEFLDQRSLVIRCYKERPADTGRVIYEAQSLCSLTTVEGGE